MIIQKADLFREVREETMNEVSRIMVEQPFEKGALVFKAGDPANSFYLIVDGRVRLSIGVGGQIDYTASQPGEAFGWTGMVDRPTYVATAECLTPCRLIKIEKSKLATILDSDPQSGQLFYKRLAGAVVQRLIDNYGAFISERSLSGVTYGSGQVVSPAED